LYNKWLIGTGTPKTIAGLVLWLDGSDRNSIVTSNTSVTLWRDKSGSSNDAPPGTSPVFIPSGINSKSVVRFDGSTQYLDIPFSSVLNPASFSVLFVVNVRGGVNTFRSPITSRAGFTAPNLKGYYFYADASNLWQFTVGNGNWNGFSATPASIGKPTLVAGIYSGAGSTLTGYVDGGLSGTTSSTLVVNPSSPTRIGAGASETSPNFFFNGDIAEIIIYNNSISAAQRQQLESYLRVKWGIGFNAPFFGVGF
jgi:hypothetical protein